MDDKRNICGPRIREARQRLQMAQVELSAALEIDFHVHLNQGDISEIETQNRSVKDYELQAIAHILNVSAGWLLTGEGTG